MRNNRTLPLLIVNSTQNVMKIYRHGLVAKIVKTTENEIKRVENISALPNMSEIDSDQINVSSQFRPEIEHIIYSNKHLFAKDDTSLGQTDVVKMKINTGDHSPIKLKPYRTPLQSREIVDKAITDMLDAKIMERSRSPWSFPVVIVDKKDGTKRFCVDFRKLNQITKKNSYPLPLIDDILTLLGKAKYFSSLDLNSGYWQVAMDEKDKEKTAFTCHSGLYEFLVMLFGLSNAPAIFQELMSVVLSGYSQFAVAYLDDILIFSPSIEEHLQHLQFVFNRLRQHNLRLKLKKCSFAQTETNYLGFIIGFKWYKTR